MLRVHTRRIAVTGEAEGVAQQRQDLRVAQFVGQSHQYKVEFAALQRIQQARGGVLPQVQLQVRVGLVQGWHEAR